MSCMSWVTDPNIGGSLAEECAKHLGGAFLHDDMYARHRCTKVPPASLIENLIGIVDPPFEVFPSEIGGSQVKL